MTQLSPPIRQDPTDLPTWMIWLIATACGLVAANIYYAQPLVGPISRSLGISLSGAGLIVSMTQIGYGAGLLLVVPLGDLVENRRLVLAILGIAIIAATGAAMATHAVSFFAASLLLGIGSVAVQILVPFTAHLVPSPTRGRVVGSVMSGLMLGIMFARPAASIIADLLSWHAVFAISALLMSGLTVMLRLALPQRKPPTGLRYVELLVSMTQLVRDEPILRRRAFYHSCLFGAFSLFWTAVPLLLADRFHLSQIGIALFAFVGVGGAIAAPIAGRAADRGWSKHTTSLAMMAVAISFLLSWLGSFGSSGSYTALLMLAIAAVLLDCGVTANFVLGQRAIFSLADQHRSRLNGLYMAAFFISGAACSGLGGWAYTRGGWFLTACIGIALPLLALLGTLTERAPDASLRASSSPKIKGACHEQN
jgi:predicted MFS family arabinose efflux permease